MKSRMLRTLAPAITALLLGISVTADADASKIETVFANDTVTLERESLMLSDLFSGIDADSDARVGDAPLPGEKIVVRANTLRKIAQSHDIDWAPENGRVSVTVSREGRAVPLQMIRTAIEEKLIEDYVADRVEIEFNNRRLSLMAPVGVDPEVIVETIDYSSRSQRFAALISVPIGNGKSLRTKAMGQVHAVIEVPVLGRHAAPGEVIRAEDIVWTDMRAKRSNHNTVTNIDQLVGHSVRRPISAGRVIRRTDVQPLQLVQKGDLVTMVFKTRMMTLTLRGQALENGARKQSIRVKNLASGKTVIGSVTDSGIVAVAGPRLAMN